MARTVGLRHVQDEGGTQSLTATLRDDGGVSIEGQDLGAGVSGAFGAASTEYEYAFSIAPAAVPALRAALGTDDDVLAALAAYFGRADAEGPMAFLDAHGVAYAFWSRLGD